MNNLVVFDAGNSLIKGKTAGDEQQFPHALYQLTEAEFEQIRAHNAATLTPGVLPPGYARVNGDCYAYGETAERRRLVRLSGSGRYTGVYYGVLLAITLGRLYRKGGEIVLFASHAPRDVIYAKDLARAAFGSYQVEIAERVLEFHVGQVSTFDEPVGGLMNVILAADGQHYAHSDIQEGDSLVFDIGGMTTDLVAVRAGGELDYTINESIELGIQQVERDFERSLRARYKSQFKRSTYIPPHKLREAIRTGAYSGGGDRYDCADQVTEATTALLARIAEVYQAVAGGPARWDNIILTGGGSAMLYQRLVREVLDHRRVFLADDDLECMHLANVRGGLKLWRLYQTEGIA